MSEYPAGRVLSFSATALRSARPARSLEARAEQPDDLGLKCALCLRALIEADRVVAASNFGLLLRRLLFRADELLEDMDDILMRLRPGCDPEAFARAATLHRKLESIQSQLPREYRLWLAR